MNPQSNTLPARQWELAPAIYLVDAVSRVEHLGYEIEPFLKALGLSRASLEEPGKFVRAAHYHAIIEHCVVTLGVPEVGFIQPESQSFLFYGAAGIAVITSASVGAALEASVAYQDLLAVPLQTRLEQRRGRAALRYGAFQHGRRNPGESVPEWQRMWAAETCTSSFAAFVASAPQGSSYVRGMQFSYPEPAHANAYRDAFDWPITFGTDCDEVSFDRALLDVPLGTANPFLNAYARRQCAGSLNKLASPAGLPEQIEGILLGAGRSLPSLAVVAERLHISERTLQRRLAATGVSYRAIVTHTRHAMAQQLLAETDLPIKEVAYLLGYTEASNFSLAFKHTEGVAPQAFRQAHGAGTRNAH